MGCIYGLGILTHLCLALHLSLFSLGKKLKLCCVWPSLGHIDLFHIDNTLIYFC